ncbi:MAG: NUDIX hydrolase [Pedobacter sp.]|nr:MAG: NUDIX hydrolase [Pedobacter sp.]
MSKYTVKQDRDWYNALPTKRGSAALVMRDGNMVLMVKDNYKDFWTFPGGVIDAGESPFVAALRETHEEVGVIVKAPDAKFLSVSYVPEKNGFKDRLHFFFITDAHPAVSTISIISPSPLKRIGTIFTFQSTSIYIK